MHFKWESAKRSRSATDPVICRLNGRWKNDVSYFLSVVSDLLGNHACAERHSRIYSKQWLEICHIETVYRNRIRNGYKQYVILISNANRFYAGPSGLAVRGEGNGRWLLRSRVWIPLRTWMFVMLRCSQQRPCDELGYLSKESSNVFVRNKCVIEKAWALQLTA
jgi:hypothetical protein